MLAEYLEKIKSRNNVTILKAALYARYSSDMQRGESVDAQIRLIKEFAEKNNIVIVKQYVDEAKSAKWDSRESFQQMIKDSKTSEWQVVIVHKLDRFARNRDDSTMYRIQLRRYRKYLISAVEQLGDSPEDQLLEAMIEAMAEFYSKNLARETIKGLTENALKGKHCGGIPPLGYELDEFNFYKVNEFEAQGVKLIYSLFLEGKSYTEIIAEINLLGYRTKRNRLFTRNSLYEILRNEKYTGTFIYNKMERDEFSGVRSRHKYKPENEIIKVENMIPEIISKEDWKSVQTILNRRKKAYTNHAKDANESLTFTYSAVVNEKAINDTNTSTNKAEVSYGNDPDHLTTGAPSEVKVLTHTLKINKVDEQSKPLSGAEFALYRNNVDSDKLKFVDEGNGTYRIATTDDGTTTDTLVSPEGGVITVKGLSEGDYVIEETKAPDGYAKLKNTINKTISVDENDPQTVTVEEKVTNKTESWLPETGGMGTVIFTVVGVVGVLAILSTYFKKGKKREEA